MDIIMDTLELSSKNLINGWDGGLWETGIQRKREKGGLGKGNIKIRK